MQHKVRSAQAAEQDYVDELVVEHAVGVQPMLKKALQKSPLSFLPARPVAMQTRRRILF